MSAAAILVATISQRPKLSVSPNFLNDFKSLSNSFAQLSISKFRSSPFISRELIFCNRGIMAAQVGRFSPSGTEEGPEAEEQGLSALEQEPLVHGSLQSASNSLCGSLELTLNRLSKWLVAALFGVIILWRHDGEALWAAMGSVLNTMLSVVLKKLLNQERPHSTQRADPGMPSSHAQSIFYTVIFVINSLVEWLGVNGATLALGGVTFALGSYFSWLRVSQKLHTISQVIVGALVGSLFSVLWLCFWNAAVLDAFNTLFWVRVSVILGAATFCAAFLVYIIVYWLRDERM